ncbi:unnamed protein product, partial [Amoebophrya sp. A25]
PKLLALRRSVQDRGMTLRVSTLGGYVTTVYSGTKGGEDGPTSKKPAVAATSTSNDTGKEVGDEEDRLTLTFP